MRRHPCGSVSPRRHQPDGLAVIGAGVGTDQGGVAPAGQHGYRKNFFYTGVKPEHGLHGAAAEVHDGQPTTQLLAGLLQRQAAKDRCFADLGEAHKGMPRETIEPPGETGQCGNRGVPPGEGINAQQGAMA